MTCRLTVKSSSPEEDEEDEEGGRVSGPDQADVPLSDRQ